MTSLVGKKVKVIEKDYEGIEGIIIVHEKDDVLRDVIRLKIIKGNTSITDYFLKDVELISE